MANIATNYLGRPTRIGLDSDWSKISVGAGHCLALKKGGTLWAWGQNDHGQVGVGTTNSPTGPAQVDGELDWRAISAGAFNSYALKKDGSIWGWGADPISGGSRDDLEPNRLNSGRDWAAIAAGDFHLLALRTDGTIWIRGQNAGIVAPGFVKGSTAEFVEVGSDTNWAEIYSGSGYFFARQRDGSWWASGTNNRIQFGFSPISAALKSEPSGLSLEPWAIASGNSTTLLLAQDGSLWSWGIRLGVPAHDPRFEKLIRFANSVRARVNRGQVLFPERAEPSDSKPYRVWMLPDSMRRQLQADASTTWPRRK